MHRMIRVLTPMVRMDVGGRLVMRSDGDSGLVLAKRGARHPDACCDRMERQHQHQDPDQECLDSTVHR